MMDDRMHAAMPQGFWLEGLDNGARLDWDAPNMTSPGASVIGYRIDRKAWNSNPDHPINAYGGATIDIFGVATDYSDLGLAYNSVYTYQVRAIVEYDAEHWWNALSPAMKSSVVTNGGEMMYAALSDDAKALVYAAYDLQEGKYPYMIVDEWWDSLDCVKMNDAVSPMVGEPAVGSDDPTHDPRSAYCYMYNDLKVDAKSAVHRAWMNSYNRYAMGVWTYKRTLETAESGGRLAALLDPPSMVRMLSATPACADRVSVMWQAPNDMGTVPATDQNGVYVGPDYIGADDAGREEVGTDATMVTYQVQRMVNNGPWAAVTPVGMTYTDTNVAYENSYKYRVRAMNGAGLYGPWAMVTEDLTEPDEPQMPRSLNVDPVNGTVELQWDPPTDTEGLWRKMADFDRAGDESGNLQYIVQRKVGNGNWQTLPIANPPKMATQYHKYADNFADTLTQAYTDTSPPVGLVSYRVAALVHGCNPSPFNQKDPVTIVAQPLGSATGLSTTTGATAGTVELTWTAGTSSTRHWLAGVKVSDWEAGDFSNMIWRATTGQSSDTVTGLTSGAQYAFTVLSGGANSWDGTWAPIQRVTPN